MAGPPALDVWLYDVHVARVTERRTGRFQLTYTADALERWPRGRPLLSVSMPLVPSPHPPSVVGPFLEGLLPEGEARTILESTYGVRRGDVRGLLAAIGRDCAGAVVIVAAGDRPPAAQPAAPAVIGDDELAHRIRSLPHRPLGDDDTVRVSLAGQQAKLPLVRRADGRWALPEAGTPSTHILKPGDARYADMTVNEAFALRIARALGLTDIDVELLEVDEMLVLVVSRYDRARRHDGSTARVHQEDACQALAIQVDPDGRGKYEDSGGPALEDVARILEVHNGDPEQTARLAEIALFTVAIGNADGHGKNLSLLHPPDEPLRLAPLYDVLSTVFYPTVETAGGPRDVSSTLAMRINGKERIDEVTVDDVLAEADRWHHGPGLHDRLANVLARLPAAVASAADATPLVPDRLVELVLHRTADLAAGRAAREPQAGGSP